MQIRALPIVFVALLLPLAAAGDSPGLRLAASDDPGARKLYIVQMQKPAAAEQLAPVRRSVSQSSVPDKSRRRFNMADPQVSQYTAALQSDHAITMAKAGPDVEPVYSYYYGLNGFAARMTEAQALKLRNLPEVRSVWEDEVRELATDRSPAFLGLFDSDGGLRGDLGLDGSGIVIGFIDSGVYPEHPALADSREADRPRACRSSWGETTLLGRWLCRRYRQAPDVRIFDPPENWNGSCQVGEQFDESHCNNKLIGARWFIDGALSSGAIDPDEMRSARDVDGHGTHTITTGAGNRVRASIFGTRIGDVQGIAPGARVAVYKACWLRPGDQRATCNTSDLARAIDAAVADGVDIINYSVGSTLLRVSSPDDLALLGATKAGVLAVVAAGNEGPNLGTIGSPAGGPWVITAAASTRDGQFSRESMQVLAPSSIAAKYAVKEANFTPRLADNDPIEARLVLVDDDDTTLPGGSTGTTSDACQVPVNSDELQDNIALIRRGGCNFDIKIANASDAGAVAVVIINLSGPPIVMNGDEDLVDIPALMVGQADGNLFINEIDAGNNVEVVLDKGLLLTESDTGNIMAGFSGRGPGPVRDILKPDVTAPGVNILAGFTPDAVNSTPDETFAYLSGTSMSTPHVAGAAALLLEAHPDWSPAAIKSALMTSARRDLTQSDGSGQANPFEFGAGHIVPNDAVNPGLVFELTASDYDAFACGQRLASVPDTRCDELEAAGFSFAPQDMNQPSIAIAELASEQTVTRTVTNVGEDPANYTVSIANPIDMQVVVDPPTLSLAPGESANFDVTVRYVSGPHNLWRFGSVTWATDDHSVRSTIAVKPVFIADAPGEITSFGGTGSASFDVSFGYDGAYTPRVHGLNLPEIQNGFVDNDPTKTFSFRQGSGVTQHRFDVPAGQLYLRFALFDALTDGDDDLDMYVFYCGLNNEGCTQIGQSGEPTSQERFDVFRPAAGVYGVLVHGFATDQDAGGPGANYQLFHWRFGEIDDAGNLSVSGPPFVGAGTTGTVTIDWANLGSNAIHFGGISHNTPEGLSGLTLVTIGN